MNPAPNRRRFLTLAAALFAPVLCQAAPIQAPKDLAFTLGEFSHLLLTTDNQGYRLCHVVIAYDGEQQRTSFTGFKMLKSSAKELIFRTTLRLPLSRQPSTLHPVGTQA